MKKGIATLLCLCSIGSNAMADQYTMDTWFAGADLMYMWGKGSRDYRNVLPKHYPKADIYIAYRFWEAFSMELGYFMTTEKKRSGTFDGSFFEVNATGATFDSKCRTQGLTFDILAYLPLTECWEFYLGPGIGLGSTKVSLSSSNTTINNLYQNTSRSNRLYGRVKGGVQYMLTQSVGLRTFLLVDAYGPLVIDAPNISSKDQRKPLNTATSFGVGAFFNF